MLSIKDITSRLTCRNITVMSLAIGAIILYIITIPVKDYHPHVTKQILEKNLKLPDIEDVDKNDQGMPLIFHQMWSTDKVPNKFKTVRETCLTKNKEYKSVTWTHDLMITFMAQKYPWFLDIYLNYPYQIQRVDVARYFILYHYGGVYLDMDCECKVSFKKIFSNMTKEQTVLVIETDLYGISNGFMGSRKKDPFFEFVVNRLPNFAQRYIFRHPTIILSSGPMFLTRSWNNYENRAAVYVVPLKYFRDIYFHEQFSGSWHGWDTEIVDLFHFHFPAILMCTGVLLLCILIYKLYVHQYCSSECTLQLGRTSRSPYRHCRKKSELIL